jgi:hypothetical protein
MEEEQSDNFIFTISALAAGCGIGFLLALGIAFSFHLDTYEPTLVVPPTWITPTPMTMWDSSSIEDIFTNKYAVYGIAVLAIGLMLCPTILLAIIVWRRVRGADLCSQDVLGIGVVVLGIICGLATGLGSFYAGSWSTRGNTGAGLFLLILVPFSIVIIVLLLVCYRHHKEGFGSLYGGIF